MPQRMEDMGFEPAYSLNITYNDAFLVHLSGCFLPSPNSKHVSFTLLLS